jgi:beta-lactamase class A
MDTFFTELGGPVGVYVDHLDTDLVLQYNADELYPTASTLKTPLLYELYRQAEAGMVNLTDRITLSHDHRVPGSGVLQDLDEGLQPTIRDLSELMIIVSDNWATDMIYNVISRDAMAATLQELGLSNTFIPLNIREMFCLIAEKDFDDDSVNYDELKEALKHSKPDDDCLAYQGDRRNNVSSPRDMGTLMRIIHEGKGLSAEGRERVIQTLKNQNFNTVIPGRLPIDREIETAHKTGSLRGVKADVGIVYSPEVNYIITFMSKQQLDSAETTDRMAHASRWVWDRLIDGD